MHWNDKTVMHYNAAYTVAQVHVEAKKVSLLKRETLHLLGDM